MVTVEHDGANVSIYIDGKRFEPVSWYTIPTRELAPKWKRRRRRLEVRRERETNMRLDGYRIFEARRSPLARALRGGWRQEDPFLVFLRAAWDHVWGEDPRKLLVGVAHSYRAPASPTVVDLDLVAAGVPRGALCAHCGKVLVVEHFAYSYGSVPERARCACCQRSAATKPWSAP